MKNKTIDDSRRRFVALAASTTFAGALPARATVPWPSRPVTIVSPYSAGGTNDLVARLLADRLQRALGQAFTVENRAGAAGVVGVQSVIRAKPDGYTLLAGNNGCLVIQSAGRVPSPYDPSSQLDPIMKVVDATQFIAVNSEVPVKTVGELITYAKQNPGKLNLGSAGAGSFGQFLSEYLKLKAGIEMVHIPCAGSSQALTEMMAGRVQVLIDPIVLTQSKNPLIRILATLNSKRVDLYPQYPTIVESGGPEIDITGWFGLQGPAGLPAEVVSRIVQVGESLKNDREAQTAFNNQGLVWSFASGPKFLALIHDEMNKVADIRERAHIQIG